ncbi:MAG: 3-methyl-2-oxobutanoate hydroxymethyltransferase [Pseudomonas oryzihabitans]
MPDISLTTLQGLKQRGEKIAMLTAYDATFAQAASQAGVEMLLIGDSLGMVLQGHDSTLPVTLDDMVYHTACVKRGHAGAFIVADLSFMTYATLEQTLTSAGRLMQAGAQMVKLEGDGWLAEPIRRLAANGVPVCAHLGLTPQSVNVFGGFKVQGRDPIRAQQLRDAAKELEDAGAAMLLLECVPSALAEEITRAAQVPVIGIGAGAATDGQVLVLHDMLGLALRGRTPKFVRNFMAGQDSIQAALAAYVAAVKDGSFPAPEHGFSA